MCLKYIKNDRKMSNSALKQKSLKNIKRYKKVLFFKCLICLNFVLGKHFFKTFR